MAYFLLGVIFFGVFFGAILIPNKKNAPKEKSLKITIEEYIAQGGHVCPFCGSKNIFGRFTAALDTANSCGDCNSKWTDIYDDTLTAKNKLAGIRFAR